MTGITAAIPYGFSALAQLKWRWIDHREMQTPRFARDMIVAVLALVFSILFIVYSRNTGHSFWTYWAPYFLAAVALLLGIPVYLAQRRHMSRPEPVPPYRLWLAADAAKPPLPGGIQVAIQLTPAPSRNSGQAPLDQVESFEHA